MDAELLELGRVDIAGLEGGAHVERGDVVAAEDGQQREVDQPAVPDAQPGPGPQPPEHQLEGQIVERSDRRRRGGERAHHLGPHFVPFSSRWANGSSVMGMAPLGFARSAWSVTVQRRTAADTGARRAAAATLYRGDRPAEDGSGADVGRPRGSGGTTMDKELQELVDRRAIDDLLLRYSTALDTRQWDLLDQVFTADAQIDYATSGGIKGNREDLKRWFRDEAFVPFTSWQHHLTNMAVELDGDTATGRTSVYNPLAFIGEDGASAVLHVGAWYDDRFARTPDGWRITERSLGMAWTDGPFPPTVPAASRHGVIGPQTGPRPDGTAHGFGYCMQIDSTVLEGKS